MGETDRQTDKSSRWAFTAYEAEWPLFQVINDLVAEWGWQTEVCPNTQRKHYQGYLRTKRQVRFAQLKKVFPGVHLETARDWNKLLNYCKKKDSAVPGTQVNEVNRTKALTMAEALIALAEASSFSRLKDMSGNRLVEEKDNMFWDAVASLLEGDANLVGLYTQPQYHRAFIKLSRFWENEVYKKADEGVYADLVLENTETDRQTDECAIIPDEVPSRQVQDDFYFRYYNIIPDAFLPPCEEDIPWPEEVTYRKEVKNVPLSNEASEG